jgi:hypothetical protein
MAPRQRRRSPLAATAAAAVLLAAAATTLAAAPRGAAAATDCVGALVSASMACTSELAAVRDGGAPPSVSARCCQAAATVFSAAFGDDCACGAAVAPYKALLDKARAAIAGGDGKCPELKAAPAPSCGARGASAAAAAAAPPVWGANSICATQVSCVTKCTPANRGANPTAAQLTAAQRCTTRTNGYCNGLGVDGATTGTTQCGTGVPVADGTRGQKCFQCCTVRLPKTGNARTGKNACVNPASSGGGGGGGGGGCFPGDATVVVEGARAPVAMRDVRIGDRVLSADPKSGAVGYETVYWMGHQLAGANGEFVRLEVAEASEASSADPDEEPRVRTLELTRKHLVPVMAEGGDADGEGGGSPVVYKRAMDVDGGDVVMVADAAGGAARPATVLSASEPAARAGAGLYAPLTTGGGHVVVDGVLASAHSNNMLDPLAEFLGRRDLLQWAYETFGASVLKAAYRVAGPEAMRRAAPIVSGLGLGDAAQLAAGVRGLLTAQPPRVTKTA